MMKLPICPADVTMMVRAPGGHFTPTVSSSAVQCPTCGRKGWYLSDSIGNAVVIFDESPGGPTDAERAVLDTYANKALIVAWRARKAALDEHHDEESRRWKAEVFYPKFPEFRDWPEKLTFHDLPPEAQALYYEQFGGTAGRPRHQQGMYIPIPTELRGPVYPPQVPEDFPATVFYWTRSESLVEQTHAEIAHRPSWFMVDPEYSRTLVVPPDPILVDNERFFASVWSSVDRALVNAAHVHSTYDELVTLARSGHPLARDILNHNSLPPRREVRNAYGGIQPWYAFDVGNVTVTVGRRSHVVEVSAVAPFDIPVDELRARATRDDCTFEAHGPQRRTRPENLSGWSEAAASVRRVLLDAAAKQPDGCLVDGGPPDAGSTHVCIHAGTSEKLVEYLVVLIQGIRHAQRLPAEVV